MPYFLIHAQDKPDSMPLRLATRPAHLDWLKALGDRVKVGGAYWDDAEQTALGSVLIVEAATVDEVRTLWATEPFTMAGLYASLIIQPYRWVINPPPSA